MSPRQFALAVLFAAALASPLAAQTPPAAVGGTTGTPATKTTVPPPAAKTTPQVAAPININTASVTQLKTLPGIGPSRSAAIVKGRPYKSPDELVTKKVLSQGVYDKIKSRLTTG